MDNLGGRLRPGPAPGFFGTKQEPLVDELTKNSRKRPNLATGLVLGGLSFPLKEENLCCLLPYELACPSYRHMNIRTNSQAEFIVLSEPAMDRAKTTGTHAAWGALVAGQIQECRVHRYGARGPKMPLNIIYDVAR